MSTWQDDENTTLDGLTAEGDPATVTPRDAPDAERYLPGETIGAGGMGEVKVALDRRLRREVAIKVLSHETAGARDRFFAEAQVTAQLEHPNIVPVHDVGLTREGRPFLAMKRVRGAALHEVMPSLEREERLDVFRKVCDAVAFAHSHGVLHRDIKPENVMVGAFGEVLLMDWGLAREAEGGSSLEVNRFEQDSRRTRQGMVAGTPAFMAPEQAEGRLDRLNERTDVYGLGALLYEIVVGEPPFSGESAAVIQAVRDGAWVPPRTRDARVPRELDAVIRKAMARRPEDRYPSARALREDIDAWLGHRPLPHVRSSAWSRLGKWVTRHRAPVLAGGAVGLVALALLSLSLVRYARDVGAARDEAVQEAARARSAETEAVQGLVDAKVSLADALSARGQLSAAAATLTEALGLAANADIDRRRLELARSLFTTRSPLPISRCTPHGGAAVRALTLSGDGRRALSWGEDGRVVEWDVGDCAVRRDLTLPPGMRYGAVSLDGGARFAVVDNDSLFDGDLESGVGAPIPLNGQAWRVTLEPQRTVVALVDAGALIRERGQTRTERGPQRQHSWPKEGYWLGLSAGARADDGGVWRADEATPLFEQPGVNDVDAGAQRAIVATSMGLQILDLGGQTPPVDRPGWPVFRVGVIGDRGWALGFDGLMELMDLRSGAAIAGFVGPSGAIAAAMSEDGRVASIAGRTGEVLSFLRPLGDPRRLPVTDHAAQGVAYRAERSLVAVADDAGLVRVVPRDAGVPLWTRGPFEAGARGLAFSPDGRLLAVALRTLGVAVLDAETGEERAHLDCPRTVSVDWLSDGRLATLAADGKLYLMDPATGELWAHGPVQGGPAWDLSVGPGDRILVATHLDVGGARTLLGADGAVLWTQPADAPAYHHAFSPDGRQLAIGRQDGKVELRDTADGRERMRLEADAGPTMAVAYSPDGALLATGGFSAAVVLWDARTGERLRAEQQHTGPVLDLVFTPSGDAVISVGADGGVSILPLNAHSAHAALVADLNGDAAARARAYAALGWGQ